MLHSGAGKIKGYFGTSSDFLVMGISDGFVGVLILPRITAIYGRRLFITVDIDRYVPVPMFFGVARIGVPNRPGRSGCCYGSVSSQFCLKTRQGNVPGAFDKVALFKPRPFDSHLQNKDARFHPKIHPAGISPSPPIAISDPKLPQNMKKIPVFQKYTLGLRLTSMADKL